MSLNNIIYYNIMKKVIDKSNVKQFIIDKRKKQKHEEQETKEQCFQFSVFLQIQLFQ